MRVRKFETLKPGSLKACALTIGAFDGVHLGHRKIFKTLISLAKKRKLLASAITFQPLPREVFNNERRGIAILSFEERKKRIEQAGIELLVVVDFNLKFAQKSAGEFMDELRRKLNPKLIVIGHDFRFGSKKTADECWLRSYCGKMGIELKVVSAVKVRGELVSSSRIRSLLKEGDLERANQLLGEPYQLEGRVIFGHHRGKKLGFATANLSWSKEPLVPKGVYVARVFYNQRLYPAVVNIGFNPTFGDKKLNIEAHLLDFKGELYGKRLKISLLKFLRAEEKFERIEDLVVQIKKDIKRARAYLRMR